MDASGCGPSAPPLSQLRRFHPKKTIRLIVHTYISVDVLQGLKYQTYNRGIAKAPNLGYEMAKW